MLSGFYMLHWGEGLRDRNLLMMPLVLTYVNLSANIGLFLFPTGFTNGLDSLAFVLCDS